MKTRLLATGFVVCLSSMAQAAIVIANRVVITNTAFTTAFHIAEVQVFEQGSGANVAAGAAGATALASSTGWGTQPAWANDGNTNGDFGASSTWHDLDGEAGDDPAQIDQLTITFSGPKTINSFDLWGRSDGCCPERDDSMRVEFFNGATLVGQNEGVGIFGAVPAPGVNAGVQPITAIPEPAATAGILALALAGMMRRRRTL